VPARIAEDSEWRLSSCYTPETGISGYEEIFRRPIFAKMVQTLPVRAEKEVSGSYL
jgi:hypothetical protein